MPLFGNIGKEIGALFFKEDQQRIDDIIPDIIIRESHHDRLMVTDHPVAVDAQGNLGATTLSDHAYMLPAEVTIECGFSNSSIQGTVDGILSLGDIKSVGDFASKALSGNLGEGYVKTIYEKFLHTLRNCKTIDIVTSKRIYKDMMLTDLSTETTRETNYSMIIVARARQIQKAMLYSVQVAPVSSDTAKQAQPKLTAPTKEMGTKQPKESSSMLYKLGKTFGLKT